MTNRRSLPMVDIRWSYDSPFAFADAIRDACHHIGFFLLRHDIPLTVTRRQLEQTREFFSRPIQEKLAISYEQEVSFRGYMKLGVENTAGIVDAREQIEYATEENPYTTDWPPYERLRGKNPWPRSQSSLRTATEEYTRHALRHADAIRDALLGVLEMDEPSRADLFGAIESREKPHWVIKLVSYPTVESDAVNGWGVGAHTDTNFLTLILQDDIGGLQVCTREGDWIDVPSDDEDVLVCNLGEQAEILSQGYFLATPHRVLANTHDRQRCSVPLFYNPLLSATIRPCTVPSSLPWDRSPDDVPWRRSDNAMLSTVGDNTFKSLARFHAQVFAKNHSDLVTSKDGRVAKRERPAD